MTGAKKPYPTILVDISLPLLGGLLIAPTNLDSSNVISTAEAADDEDEDNMKRTRKKRGVMINREPLRIQRGEWVCVVGWLEGKAKNTMKKVH